MSTSRRVALLLALITTGLAVALRAAETQNDLFPRPTGLAPAVAFWTRVYSDLDSASGVIHDNRKLDRVYQVLYLNPHAPPDAQNEVVDKTLADYRGALLVLASGKRDGLTVIEQQALKAWGEGASAAELRAAAERLRFQRGQADRFQKGLNRSKRWQAYIHRIFRERGLPEELAALPHVESSYNSAARSKAGAVGLWQFMPATARRYLRVDRRVDERLNPYKSSRAAAHFLQHIHSVLGTWPLAITAYNHGMSGVRRAVKETGTEDLEQIIERYESPSFGFASRNYYAAFLAAMDVSNDPERYFGSSQQETPAPIRLAAPAYLPAEVLAVAFGVDQKQLRDLNPSLHHGIWNGTYFVPRGRELSLPGTMERSEAEALLQRLAKHFGFSAQKPQPFYEVRLGDSLSEIAEIHETKTRTLLTLNKLRSAHQIHAGQVLRVPMGANPEPLGAGAAVLLAAQRAARSGGVAVDLPRLIAVNIGHELLGYGDVAQVAMAPGEGINECSETGIQVLEEGPMVSGEADDVWAALPAQPDLAADPANYEVSADGTIEIQVGETLGHYAEWLGLRSNRVRKLNGLRPKQSLIVGRRLKMDFSKVTPQRFEQLRVAHHQSRQLEYFERHRITDVVEHRITEGDSLWLLAVQQYRVPLWLLRQYNPDIGTDTVLPLRAVIYVPVVVELPDDQQACLRAQAKTGTEGGA